MKHLNVDRAVFFMAGTLTLVGLLLAITVSQWFLLVPTFVGANMLQSSLTGWCPAAMIFERLGLPRAACSIHAAAPGRTLTADPLRPENTGSQS